MLHSTLFPNIKILIDIVFVRLQNLYRKFSSIDTFRMFFCLVQPQHISKIQILGEPKSKKFPDSGKSTGSVATAVVSDRRSECVALALPQWNCIVLRIVNCERPRLNRTAFRTFDC